MNNIWEVFNIKSQVDKSFILISAPFDTKQQQILSSNAKAILVVYIWRKLVT